MNQKNWQGTHLTQKGFIYVAGGYMSPVNDAYQKKKAKQISFQQTLTVLSRVRSLFCDSGFACSLCCQIRLII
ncbi:hypothetical protein QVD17_26499 [Tagetes erecta]|uniref:Uncharacterized protein n=1 Tax=Tagetes erecta TaxID=13708 RepID=A0AAD8KB59_TARER|nr:hypothetical protein QVD17_26499 [Tagetes erecta]